MTTRSSTSWLSAVLTRRATTPSPRPVIPRVEIGSRSSLNTDLSPGVISSMWTRVVAATFPHGQRTRAQRRRVLRREGHIKSKHADYRRQHAGQVHDAATFQGVVGGHLQKIGCRTIAPSRTNRRPVATSCGWAGKRKLIRLFLSVGRPCSMVCGINWIDAIGQRRPSRTPDECACSRHTRQKAPAGQGSSGHDEKPTGQAQPRTKRIRATQSPAASGRLRHRPAGPAGESAQPLLDEFFVSFPRLTRPSTDEWKWCRTMMTLGSVLLFLPLL